MEDNKLKFVVHARKEGNKFVLEEITNYILKNLESFHDKIIIVTFELPITTNEIKIDSGKHHSLLGTLSKFLCFKSLWIMPSIVSR